MSRLIALALLLGCQPSRGVEPSPEAPLPKPAVDTDPTAPTLDWTLTREGDHLRVSYTLHNRGSARLYVVDQLYTGSSGPRAPSDRVVVAPSDRLDTVRFVRGVVETATQMAAEHAPGAGFVDPGQTYTGSATVPLPIAAWHPYAPPDPIPAQPRYAELQIATLSGEGTWGTVPLEGGKSLTVPQLDYYFKNERLVSGGIKPIP